MNKSSAAVTIMLLLVLITCSSVAHASYLGIPRINFEGKFRADAATNNNDRMNFLFASVNKDQMELATSWNQNGTNAWSFVDCKVTSVVTVDKNGKAHVETNPDNDRIINMAIVNNPNTTFAKFVDIDVDDQLLSTTIYGMTIGINWDPIKKTLNPNSFIGNYTPAVIATDVWDRQARSKAEFQQIAGSRSVSKISDVVWSETIIDSPALKQLKQSAAGGLLSIRLTVFNYSKNPDDNWFTYGHVVGSIGVASREESLQFPETRVMKFIKNPPIVTIPDSDCQTLNPEQLLYGAYFDVDKQNSVIRIDFSNSFPLGIQGEVCDLFPMYLALRNPMDKTYEIISKEIPYKEKSFYEQSAIIDLPLCETGIEYLTTNPYYKLVLVTPVPSTSTLSTEKTRYKECTVQSNNCDAIDGNSCDTCVHVLLEEMSCLVRPTDISIHRLEDKDQVNVFLKVYHHGEVAEDKVIVLADKSLTPASGKKGEDITYVGKASCDSCTPTITAQTNSSGIAQFIFTAGDVGQAREDIRLDSQVFRFGYCSSNCDDELQVTTEHMRCRATNEGNYLVFLVWTPFTEVRPYFWDTHIYPIFYQYQYLYPAMERIVSLGDYNDVTKPQNVELIKTAMNLPVNHISYMPVTRDLSPSKRAMILEWFGNPSFPRNWKHIDEKLFETPPFCEKTFVLDSRVRDGVYVYDVDNGRGFPEIGMHIRESSIAEMYSAAVNLKPIRESPKKAVKFVPIHTKKGTDYEPAAPPPANDCNTVEDLKMKLQYAIALEFSTIPPYMTALYSIKEGFNQDVYDIIRSVVMQEMLHMAQATNLLISIGGEPQISDPAKSFIPTCFPTHLPGGVLPGLEVKLAKASPKHIRDVFMMIEFPDKILFEGQSHDTEISANAMTIGQFYEVIEKCMESLPNVTFGNVEKQLEWPWKMYDQTSHLYQVNSLDVAKDAIGMIVEQGEGTKQLDPTYLGTQHLAHFFKFGEVACKHSINATTSQYSFKGDPIDFEMEGVWHMRDNPASKNIPKNTHAYHQAKAFHSMYLSLLSALQEAFDTGGAEKLKDSMYIMESMQIQAKRLMQLEIPAADGHMQTCGPIFDYKWLDDSCGEMPQRDIAP